MSNSSDTGILSGKIAIITGASRQRGIGRACALTLAGLGADVVVTGTSRSPDTFSNDEKATGWCGAESVAAEITALGRRALAMCVDVADAASVRQMVERTVAQFGRVDLLVCAAAAPREEAYVVELTEQTWDQIFGINLRGTFLCCREVGKRLVEQGEGGRIINISSIRGKYGLARRSAYSASKAGVISFTQSLALEMAPYQVTVNAICPGDVDTGRTAEGLVLRAQKTGQPVEQLLRDKMAKIPLGRMAEPQEIANMVAFLASAAAGHITGQAFNVDGGELMI